MPARRRLVLPLLAAAFLLAACHHAKRSGPEDPTTVTAPPPTAPEVVEWLIGEQVRGTKTSNRGHVGIATYELAATASPVYSPKTCADLVQLIPIPTRSGTWLAIDASGQLVRYTEAGWSPMPTAKGITLPPIGKLIAFSRTKSANLELLVSLEDHDRELSLLTLVGARVTGIQTIELSPYQDHRDTLQRYDSARCIEGTRDCLHLTAIDDGLVLMREPELFDNRVEVKVLLDPGTRDVRYADQAGTKIYVLTPAVCPAPPDPSPAAQPSEPTADPSTKPEAAP